MKKIKIVMVHLIDKDTLVAEIKRRMNEEVNYDEDSKDFASYADFTHYSTLDTLLDFINTLEVKNVDLEKEFDKCCKNYIFDDECEVYTAKKFFELGLKAQKGE